MGKVNQQTQQNIKSLLEKGFTQRDISTRLKIPKSTVAWHSKRIDFKSTSKAGRPKILSERDELFCVKQISTGKIPTVVQLKKELKQRFDIEVTTDTIAKMLKQKGLKSAEKEKKTSSFSKKYQSKD